MAASLTLQCAAAGAVVLVSIISVQQLPMVRLPAPLPPVPRIQGPAVELVATGAAGRAGALSTPLTNVPQRRVFQEPTGIPAKVAMIVDQIIGGAAVSGTGAGVPGAVAYGDATTGGATVLPPPPVAVTRIEPAPVKVVRLGGAVQEAKLINKVIPLYPPLARAARISGKVQLTALIGRDGTVKELQVVNGHPLLVRAAVDAVRQWVYSPTKLNGEAVEVIAPIDVNFTLSN